MKLTILLILAGTLLAALPEASAGEVLIIINADNDVGKLSASAIRKYFLKKKKTWPNGEKVRPVDYKDACDGCTVRPAFLEKILELSDEDLERYWIELKYNASLSAARKVGGTSSVEKFVSRFKGGIGFIDAEEQGEKYKDKIRVIMTIPY